MFDADADAPMRLNASRVITIRCTLSLKTKLKHALNKLLQLSKIFFVFLYFEVLFL